MAVLKCKICGGDLDIRTDSKIIECAYCGTSQTVPAADDEKRLNLFNRATRLRINGEFDKAASIYENIVAEFPEDAEGYWGLVLCNYGIEYVDDPATAKKIPTCHRASFESVLKDENYNLTLEYADVLAQKIYRDEAKEIERLREEILSVSKTEKPYDIFICYKETDENGERTVDSVIAQDLYDVLTEKGYKVFFARISLEDKLGRQYEPYIFAALNSARIMLAVGTKYQYFHAVWVKNEWSRFLKLMAKDKSKVLIPCYKDMDAYDMPDEFKVLQAQDMGKVGAIQDLLRGIEKIIPKKTEKTETATMQQSTNNPTVDSLLKRAFMFLEDSDFARADDFCEQVLNIDPECARAYLGKLMAELHARKQQDLKNQAQPFDESGNYQKTIRFADEELKAELGSYIEHIQKRNENERLDSIYSHAKKAMSFASTESAYKEVAHIFESISEYQDSSALVKECHEKAEVARKDNILAKGEALMTREDISNYESAIKLFESISGWKDVNEKIYACQLKIEEIKVQTEKALLVRQKKKKRNIIIALSSAVLVFVAVFVLTSFNFKTWTDIVAVSAGYSHTVGLKEDGTVVATGNNDQGQCNVYNWTDIIAVGAGQNYTVGLKKDGTVVVTGYNYFGLYNVSDWTDIIAVSAGNEHTVGLKKDGTVVATGDNSSGQCNVSKWTDIVAVSAGYSHTVGIKKDGTVVEVGSNVFGKCNVSSWTDIVAVSAGQNHTVGIKKDGTVVATGDNEYSQCDVSDWTDIVEVSAGSNHTLGLKKDGTVVATGDNEYGECDVSDWTDIIAVSAVDNHTVGLKSDGTVVATGDKAFGKCNVGIWKGFFGTK